MEWGLGWAGQLEGVCVLQECKSGAEGRLMSTRRAVQGLTSACCAVLCTAVEAGSSALESDRN